MRLTPAATPNPYETCLLEVFGEAEVGDACHAAVEQDVLWLQIAMHDALLVRMGEPLQRGEHDRLGGFQRHLAAVLHDEVPQAAALAILHDEPRNALAVALVVELDDVRMAELRGDGHLPQELLHLDGLHGDTRQEHLDGDGHAIAQAAGTEDDTEATPAQLLLDFIARDVEPGCFALLGRFEQQIGKLPRIEFIKAGHGNGGRLPGLLLRLGNVDFESRIAHLDAVTVLEGDLGIGTACAFLG